MNRWGWEPYEADGWVLIFCLLLLAGVILWVR